jgi:hypothetical protein
VAEAAALLATVTGQDIEETDDGRFRIFDGTAPDRVISTVDPQARHGHKTAAHGLDGDKAHVATDPDSEVIGAAEVSPAAIADAAVGPTLLGDLAPGEGGEQAARAVVYGDTAYGSGAHLAWLEAQGSRRWSRPSLRPRPVGAGRSSPPDSGGRPGAAARHCDLNAQNSYNLSENTGHLGRRRPSVLRKAGGELRDVATCNWNR